MLSYLELYGEEMAARLEAVVADLKEKGITSGQAVAFMYQWDEVTADLKRKGAKK